MKAKIIDIKRFAVHDGDGIRTTVFLKGCPLSCVWCHNPEGISFSPQIAYYESKCISCGECVSVCPAKAHTVTDGIHRFERNACIGCGKCASVCLGDALAFYGKEMTVKELLSFVLEDRAFYENSGGGVTLSGGECLMQTDFCVAFLKGLKAERIHTAVDTCGFVSRECLDRVIPYTDVFLYDIKALDDTLHIQCTGKSNQKILENLRYLDERNCKIEIRIPFVPNYNDREMESIALFLSSFKNITRIRILPYHSYAASKYVALGMENTLPEQIPSEKELRDAEDVISKIFKKEKNET